MLLTKTGLNIELVLIIIKTFFFLNLHLRSRTGGLLTKKVFLILALTSMDLNKLCTIALVLSRGLKIRP